MPTKEGKAGTLYIDGCTIGEISKFEITPDEISKWDEKFISPEAEAIRLDSELREFSFSCDLNKMQRLKLFGIYDYCRLYGPNRRVVHLMRYGKSYRVRLKNTKRAMKILEKINVIERRITT